MKTHFLILAFACLFLQSEARLFGGSIGKWLGANPEQDATDIAGGTTFSDPTASGDTPHARAGGPEVRKTADVIQNEISNGLRKDFGFIRDSLTAFADEDGFVREGLVFCGGSNVIAAPGGTDYHPDTGLLNMVDGYGDDITAVADRNACGASECDEGSFVSLLANRIRALGYHVTHSDICIARANAALGDDIVPTARTCKLQSNTDVRKSYKCTKDDYDAGNDFFQINQKCYEAKDADACADIKDNTTQMCNFDTIEKFCQASNDYVKDKCNGATNAAEKEGESIGADGVEVNAVRRVIAYSIKNPGEVPLTDKTYVMGVKADSNGDNNCKSLRQYVAALNGMAQINAFRDKNIQEADDNWAETIKEARTFVASYAEILDNFYDKSLLIFPPIEFEEVQDCPAGDVRKSNKNDGTKSAPLCDNVDYAKVDTLNEMSANSQALLRAQCFCRKGSMAQASTVAAGDVYEADDFYLSIQDKGGRANCSDFENLASVHQFCEHGNMESQRWRSALEALEPHESSIKVFGTQAQQASRKANIYNNLLQTLPLVRDNYAVNCGRLVSSDGDEMLYSNKGGNCVPFAGMGELLYRLEFETSKAEIGSTRGASFGATAGTYGARFCQPSDKLANTMFSFRQFAYQWDHARKATSGAAAVSVPSATARIFTNDANTQVTLAGSLTDQLFAHGNSPMCNIDWTEELTGQTQRQDSSGSSYDNPYLLFDREVEEAIFNAGVAVQAKRQNAADNENLWSAVEAELTSVSSDRLNYDIAFEAAEHFMRIVTTDVNDPNVDSETDAGAIDANTEAPTPIDVCGLDETAASSSTCTKCANGAVVAVASTTLYNAGSAAQKALQRFQARSSPSQDWDAATSTDSNAQACAACPEDNQDPSNSCNPCAGESTKVAYTSGGCNLEVCGANEYMDDNTGSGSFNCTACLGTSTAGAGTVGDQSKCQDPVCVANEYLDNHACAQCAAPLISAPGSTSSGDCHARGICSAANGGSDKQYYDNVTNACKDCPHDSISSGDQDGPGTCTGVGACTNPQYFGSGSLCTTCEGDSLINNSALVPILAAGSVGTQATVCTGVGACQNNDEYFEPSTNNCTACPGDYESRDPSITGQASCLGTYCAADRYMNNVQGHANYQDCVDCPGVSVSAAGTVGYGYCDANVSTYTGFTEAALLSKINTQSGTSGQSFGSVTSSGGKQDEVHEAAGKVCRGYSSLVATCGSGHSSKDGSVVDIELATNTQQCANADGFDITDPTHVHFSSTVFGNADACLEIPQITTNGNQDEPLNSSGLVDVADAVVGNAIAPVHGVLSNLNSIHSAAANILNSGHASYFSLLSLVKDTTAASTSAYVITQQRHATDEVGNGADDIKFGDWQTDSGAYTQAVSNYNTALANYQDDLNALVDAINLMKADFEDAHTKSATNAAAATAVTNAGTERDNFEADIDNLNTDYTAIKGRTGPNGQGTALTGYATDGSSNAQTNVLAKAYREELFVAAKGAEDYAAANVDIVTKANEFGKCTNAGSLLSSGTLTLAANALGGDCNSTTQTAISTALQDLGLTGTAWNSSAADVWGQFDAGKTAALVAARYADVQTAIGVINTGVTNGKYHAAATREANANGGSLSANSVVADVTASSNAAANALRAHLHGKTNSAWA